MVPLNSVVALDVQFSSAPRYLNVSPNDKLATYGLDDPEVEGVACHFTAPERGGFKEWSAWPRKCPTSLFSCRQIAPVRFKAKFEQGKTCTRSAALYSSTRCRLFPAATSSAIFWYIVYSDRIIDGSLKNSISSVPIMPLGNDYKVQRCGDFVEPP